MDPNEYTVIIIPPEGKDSDDIQFEIVVTEPDLNINVVIESTTTEPATPTISVKEQEQVQWSLVILLVSVYLMILCWYHCSD